MVEGKADQTRVLKEWEKGYEESIWCTRLASRYVDVWPLGTKSYLKRSYRIVPFSLIAFILAIPQTRAFYNVRKDFNEAIQVLSIGMLMEYVALLKLLGAWYNKPGLQKLVLKVAKDWEASTEREQVIMWKYARITKYIIIFVTILAAGDHNIYLFRVLTLWYIDYTNFPKNETFIKPMFLKSDFYFDDQNTAVHLTLFISQYIGCSYVNVSSIAYDGYFFVSMLHFSGQLYNLQKQIEEIVDEQEKKKCDFVELLKPLIERHRELCRYTSLIEENFNKIFLVQMFFACIFLTVQGYELIMIVGRHDSKMIAELLFIVWWMLTNISSFFLYCFVSEQIRTQSTELFRSSFRLRWYDLPPKDSKLVIIIMNQTKNPIEITVGKFVPFSLEYFTAVMKTSAGYLSVLLAMKDKL